MAGRKETKLPIHPLKPGFRDDFLEIESLSLASDLAESTDGDVTEKQLSQEDCQTVTRWSSGTGYEVQ